MATATLQRQWQRQRFNDNGNRNGGCSSVFLLQCFNSNDNASTATMMATATLQWQWQRQRFNGNGNDDGDGLGSSAFFFCLGFSLFFFSVGFSVFCFAEWVLALFGTIYSGILAMKCFRR